MEHQERIGTDRDLERLSLAGPAGSHHNRFAPSLKSHLSPNEFVYSLTFRPSRNLNHYLG